MLVIWRQQENVGYKTLALLLPDHVDLDHVEDLIAAYDALHKVWKLLFLADNQSNFGDESQKNRGI